MKRRIIILIVFSFFFSWGCTTAGVAGLAKEEYVVNRFEETDQQRIAEMEELRKEIDEIKEFLTEFKTLTQNIKDMQEIADKVESRLDKMPEETLIKLFEILQDYLQVEEGSGD